MTKKEIEIGGVYIVRGLEWSCTLGRSTWEKAPALIARELGADWRLPTVQELFSVVDYACVNPATTLPDTQSSSYWSSTTNSGDPSFAWYVYFYDGNVSLVIKAGSYYVRAVRGGSASPSASPSA